jgi:hypothetical protein
MRNTILAIIAVLWGVAMIISGLAKGIPTPTSSYGAGGFAAFLFGIALFSAGGWALHRRRSQSRL